MRQFKEFISGFTHFSQNNTATPMKIKNKLGNLARLGRNQRYECHLGIPRLASGEREPALYGYKITELIN